MDIKGIDKAEILAALYNRGKVQGLGILHAEPRDMTVIEARELLDAGVTYFDYLKGRVMKIDLAPDSDEFDTWLYNRDNGKNRAEEIITNLAVDKVGTKP